MSLYRALYFSQTVVSDGQTVDDVASHIAQHSALHNSAVGLSGILLYSNEHYLQVVEGERRLVNHLLSKLQQDERHNGMQLISFSPVDERLFEATPMRLMRVDQESEEKLASAANAARASDDAMTPDVFLEFAQQILT